ncbi:protocadherin beta-16 [Alligator mississippiensis]|uniref:protocadherin beta-16 n=1 Tax=Alligator mississippiensis TaxID=8496 RepID=UPI0028777E38|nr:protocadherin beta-16 [Alligator mississippiensis]
MQTAAAACRDLRAADCSERAAGIIERKASTSEVSLLLSAWRGNCSSRAQGGGLCFSPAPGMAGGTGSRARRRQVLCLFVYVCMSGAAGGTIRYSVPEEKKSGSLLANLAEDLKVDAGELSARRARLVAKSPRQYLQLNSSSGEVLVKEKLDREELCRQIDPCLLQFEIVLENPLQLHRMEVQVQDVNDNSPTFSKGEFLLEMPEQIPANTRFPLQRAHDLDIGINGIQSYSLSTNEQFGLEVQTHGDGRKYAELVLEKPLDREEQAQFLLVLTAADGGLPRRTGSSQILIHVLDTNDNFPQFSQSVYKARIMENSPRGALVATVVARDLDLGSNVHKTYSFRQAPEEILRVFRLNELTGEISVAGAIDYEESRAYELNVQATDGGGLSAHCKMLVEVEDANDNAPEVTQTSLTSPIPEDARPGTVVALLSVSDRDVGDNGRVACAIRGCGPFALQRTVQSYYELLTQQLLDREEEPKYNVTIATTDGGSPRLSSLQTILVEIADVNDHAPEFGQGIYSVSVRENNSPALLIGSVTALDTDAGKNARVTYSILRGPGAAASSVSINPESGDIYVLRTTDYEEEREFEVGVRATDAGSPALSSEAVVRVVVLDENDNAPFVLHPLQNSTAAWSELVPRSAEPGYLVTKVVAVDADAGQNAWLSYQLLRATEPGLFAVALHSGEVRTGRAITNQNSVKQKLTILVTDNWEPPRSTTSVVSVLLVDGFSDAYMQLVDVTLAEEDQEDALTLYLLISLSSVSFLFLVSVVIIIAVRVYRVLHSKRCLPQSRSTYFNPSFHANPTDTGGTGTLSQSYCYEVCLATGSGANEFKFLRPLLPSPPTGFSTGEVSSPGSHQILCDIREEIESLRQGTASFSEDLGPRSGGPGCVVNKLIGSNEDSGQNGLLSYK